MSAGGHALYAVGGEGRALYAGRAAGHATCSGDGRWIVTHSNVLEVMEVVLCKLEDVQRAGWRACDIF